MHNALTNRLQDGKLSWDQACSLSRAGLQKFLRSELGNGLDEEQAKRFDKYGGSVLTLITIDALQERFGLERVKAKGLFSRIDALRKHSEYLAKSKPPGTEPIRRKRRRDTTTPEFDGNLEAGIKRILCNARIAAGERSSLVLHSANSDANVKQVRHTPYRYLMGLTLDQRKILRGTTFSEYEPAIKADADYWELVAEQRLDLEHNRLTTAEDSDSDSDWDEPHRRTRNRTLPVAPNIEDYILDEEQVAALQLFRDAATNNGLARPATLRDILTLFAEVARRCYELFDTGEVGIYGTKIYERRLKVEAKGTIAKLRRAKDSLFKHCASPNRAETQEEHEAYIARHPRPQKPSKP